MALGALCLLWPSSEVVVEILFICLFVAIVGWMLFFVPSSKKHKANRFEKHSVDSDTHSAGVDASQADADAHKQLINKEFKLTPQEISSLSDDNLAAIKKYGVWMSALENGEIKPITKEQVRFLDVCKGFQKPSNIIEVAWYNYKKVSSRLSGGSFGYHSGEAKVGKIGAIEKCNACDRNIDYCICSQ